MYYYRKSIDKSKDDDSRQAPARGGAPDGLNIFRINAFRIKENMPESLRIAFNEPYLAKYALCAFPPSEVYFPIHYPTMRDCCNFRSTGVSVEDDAIVQSARKGMLRDFDYHSCLEEHELRQYYHTVV